VHNAKLGVMGTPLDLLREHKLTPPEILYNRTHFPVQGGEFRLTRLSGGFPLD
jgi:hypothetical protein